MTTYNLCNYPTDQNGYILEGQIVTDGNTGELGTSDVLSCSFTAFNGTIGIEGAGLESVIGLDATSDLLELPPSLSSDSNAFQIGGFPGVFGGNPRLSYSSPYIGGPGRYVCAELVAPPEPGWTTIGPFMDGTSPWIIATAAPVPEPATLTSLGSALLGLGIVYLRRRKRHQLGKFFLLGRSFARNLLSGATKAL